MNRRGFFSTLLGAYVALKAQRSADAINRTMFKFWRPTVDHTTFKAYWEPIAPRQLDPDAYQNVITFYGNLDSIQPRRLGVVTHIDSDNPS